jgi:cytochrome c
MRKFILAVSLLGIFAACGNAEKKEEKQMAEGNITDHPDYKEGLSLVAKNRCLTCHNVIEDFTGPAYRVIATKYASYPDTIVPHLARRIITGGNGVWGDVFMTPHPQVSQEDAETMVRYIRLLK